MSNKYKYVAVIVSCWEALPPGTVEYAAFGSTDGPEMNSLDSYSYLRGYAEQLNAGKRQYVNFSWHLMTGKRGVDQLIKEDITLRTDWAACGYKHKGIAAIDPARINPALSKYLPGPDEE